jgi:hypothetical protein
VAALIKTELGVDPDLIEGKRGEFTVWVGEDVVARKDANGFPSEEDALTAVRQALAGG